MSMVVLICGASGFIGSRLCEVLAGAGHRVLRGVRQPRDANDVAIDFERDTDLAQWSPKLAGVDAVVNAVGSMKSESLDLVHFRVPVALFDACVKAGVTRVVQISALGPSEAAAFLATKHAADAHLMRLPLDWTVLRPSLVVGRDGASSRWFRCLASLPIVPLPGRGEQRLRPVALDDLCEAIKHCLAGKGVHSIVEVVEPREISYRAMLDAYRQRMGIGKGVYLPIPLAIARSAVAMARPFAPQLINRDSLRMLQAGNRADASATAHLLGRPPRPFVDGLGNALPESLRAEATWRWGELLLRLALAAVWLATAWVSLFAHPILDSLRMLWRMGVP